MLISHRIRREDGNNVEVEFAMSNGSIGHWTGARARLPDWLRDQSQPEHAPAPPVQNQAFYEGLQFTDPIAFGEVNTEEPLSLPIYNFAAHRDSGRDVHGGPEGAVLAHTPAKHGTGGDLGADDVLLPPSWSG